MSGAKRQAGIDRAAALDLIGTACALHTQRLTVANSGNVSLRYGDGFLITPSGVLYEQLSPADIVHVALVAPGDGDAPAVLAGTRTPSSEWRFHRDIYLSRPDVSAIVHTHSQYCSALACLRRGIPAFHYMVAKAGGDSIRCADYATFGTQALSDAVVQALDGRRACLMANHGMLAVGATLQAALLLAQEVESLAAQYCEALTLGEPVLLDAAEMARVARQFESYGQSQA
jgi:L-fuculose-phosphate aldolase